jgi:hypothetical protein
LYYDLVSAFSSSLFNLFTSRQNIDPLIACLRLLLWLAKGTFLSSICPESKLNWMLDISQTAYVSLPFTIHYSSEEGFKISQPLVLSASSDVESRDLDLLSIAHPLSRWMID